MEQKRIAIMVMAADAEPSTRNLQAIKDTIVKYQNEHKDELQHQYDFDFYWSDDSTKTGYKINKSKEYDNLYNIIVKEEESIYRTYEKTIRAFDVVTKQCDYDWFVRMNISMFLNIRLLDAVINQFKHGCIYGNALNSIVNLNCAYCDDLYVRGDLMIFDKSVMDGISQYALKFMYNDINMKVRDGIDHVDDCLLGCCFIDYAGKEYYKNLYMLSYTYLPDYEISDNIKPDDYHIGTRVKTVPPTETYSGYSWDDNEYRKMDVEKMKKLNEYIENNPVDYSHIKLRDVLVDKKTSRPTTA